MAQEAKFSNGFEFTLINGISGGVQKPHLRILQSVASEPEFMLFIPCGESVFGGRIIKVPGCTNPFGASSWSHKYNCKQTRFLSPYDQPEPENVPVATGRNHYLLCAGHNLSHHSIPHSLRDRIYDGEVQWGPDFYSMGAATMPQGYYDWALTICSYYAYELDRADIFEAIQTAFAEISTDPHIVRGFLESWSSVINAAVTSRGELSISLWDLQSIGRLSILGDFYNEVVPTLCDFTDRDSKGTRLLPQSCRYLFQAFYAIQRADDSKVATISASRWIDHWFHLRKLIVNKERRTAWFKRFPLGHKIPPKGTLPQFSASEK